MDYTSIQRDAYNEIRANGATLSLIIATRGTYSPSTSSFASASTTYHSYAIISNYKLKDIDGTKIKAGDKQYTIPAYGLPRIDLLTSNQTAKIIQNGVTLSIKAIDPVEPGGIAILFKVQVGV